MSRAIAGNSSSSSATIIFTTSIFVLSACEIPIQNTLFPGQKQYPDERPRLLASLVYTTRRCTRVESYGVAVGPEEAVGAGLAVASGVSVGAGSGLALGSTAGVSVIGGVGVATYGGWESNWMSASSPGLSTIFTAPSSRLV